MRGGFESLSGRNNTISDPSRHKWWVLLAIGIGTFMSALDGSVVNTILPVIRAYFNSNVAAIEWIITIYLLVVSILLLAFGRLGDIYGHKRFYLTGFVIFIASSAMCGMSPSVELIITFRAIQAIGAAMLFANSPAILTMTFPAQQRGRALGLQATMTYLGLTVGPSLGGLLAQVISWRAVFYINVPVGIIAFLLSLNFIEVSQPKSERSEGFDWTGAVIFSAGLISLLLGLNQGDSWGWFSLPTLASLGVAILLLVLFTWIESRKKAPMLDLSLFKERVFSASSASAVLNYVSLYSVIFLLPFYLIQGRSFDPAHAGLLLTAQPIIMAITAPLSGALSDKIGSRLLSTVGMLIMGVGLYLLAHLSPNAGTIHIILGLAVTGLGTGIFISPNTSALLGSAPRNRQGIASGILATARNVGMVLGVGVAGAIFTSVTSGSLANSVLFPAVRSGLMVGAGVAVVGGLISAVRGNSLVSDNQSVRNKVTGQ